MTFFAPIRAADGTHKAILDTGVDIVMMILLSIAIGMVQLLFGLAVKAYILLKDGQVFAAVFDTFFWILSVSSGAVLIVGAGGVALPAAVNTASVWVFLITLVGLAATQGRDNATIGGKIAGGLFGVYGLTGYVGDLMSYTRLVALSLSGAYIAFSFNMMIGLIEGAVPRVVFGTLIFLIGQSLNMGLSMLGGYVHSCRLQYVEFFGKFYDGGGRHYKPLAINNEFVEIKD
jgi:V/A-type H+-transporting ATPase subunit I